MCLLSAYHQFIWDGKTVSFGDLMNERCQFTIVPMSGYTPRHIQVKHSGETICIANLPCVDECPGEEKPAQFFYNLDWISETGEALFNKILGWTNENALSRIQNHTPPRIFTISDLDYLLETVLRLQSERAAAISKAMVIEKGLDDVQNVA